MNATWEDSECNFMGRVFGAVCHELPFRNRGVYYDVQTMPLLPEENLQCLDQYMYEFYIRVQQEMLL